MFESWKKTAENPATLPSQSEAQKQDLIRRIEELKAHIKNGNGVPEDGRLLARLEDELEKSTETS